MAKKLPEGVASETVSWHLADGTPTKNKNEAATAEVETVHTDGRITRRLLRRASAASAVAGDAPSLA